MGALDLYKKFNIDFIKGSNGLEINRYSITNEIYKWESTDPYGQKILGGFVTKYDGRNSFTWLNRTSYFKIFFIVFRGDVVSLDITSSKKSLYSFDRTNNIHDTTPNHTTRTIGNFSFNVDLYKNPLNNDPIFYTLPINAGDLEQIDGMYILNISADPVNSSCSLRKVKSRYDLLKMFNIPTNKNINKQKNFNDKKSGDLYFGNPNSSYKSFKGATKEVAQQIKKAQALERQEQEELRESELKRSMQKANTKKVLDYYNEDNVVYHPPINKYVPLKQEQKEDVKKRWWQRKK